MGFNPPPPDWLAHETEALASRVVAERRIVLSELRAVFDELRLAAAERYVAEECLRAYLSGASLEVQRRIDNAKANNPRGAV